MRISDCSSDVCSSDLADRVEAAGHADLVALSDGRWWGVFLATRPFAGQSTLMGRETFLLPVRWEGGWPRFLDPGEAMPPLVRRPDLPTDKIGRRRVGKECVMTFRSRGLP